MYSKSKNLLLRLLGVKVKRSNSIKWKYTAKKTSFNTFKVHITALITSPWRLYSQESALVELPTVVVSFYENSFIHLIGEPKEVGVLKEEFNKEYKVKTSYYSTVLDIIQEIMVYTQPITLKGKILYAPCTEKKCVHFEEQEFQIELN